MRVGTDLVHVREIEAAAARFGDRYLQRLYTDHELTTCAGEPARLAARFAAKEATIKVLRPVDARPDWRAIEVHRHPSGACDLVLTGTAAEQAAAAGITGLAVSLAHEGDVATAVVVATVRPTAPEEAAA
jgi:holo-[acyl-carrier protein] synthase